MAMVKWSQHNALPLLTFFLCPGITQYCRSVVGWFLLWNNLMINLKILRHFQQSDIPVTVVVGCYDNACSRTVLCIAAWSFIANDFLASGTAYCDSLPFDNTMDEGNYSIKTQNPKCRVHWCFLKLIDYVSRVGITGDTVDHVGIFSLSCKLLPLYLLSDLPHPFLPS